MHTLQMFRIDVLMVIFDFSCTHKTKTSTGNPNVQYRTVKTLKEEKELFKNQNHICLRSYVKTTTTTQNFTSPARIVLHLNVNE